MGDQHSICVECRHIRQPEDPEPDASESTCEAHPLHGGGRGLNFVTGKRERFVYAKCRDHNDGSCLAFEPRMEEL